ncbi:hypothetical protein VTN77DRAFT_3781 [Rasamsonia byssochlamydoides]|uniref:uncharacterized protein n=1 Tax=Rasamsonia byssochlamydoides TaxID=89139 RepID=UPI003743DA67
MPGKAFTNACIDCQDAEAIATVRTRPLCRDCFLRYANLKALRRMEKYRLMRHAPKDRQRKLLLPLSYGVSSSVLLHMLDGQLERQRAGSQGRAAYDLYVLVVEPSTISPTSPSCEARFDSVKKYYPMHTYTTVPFHSIFQYDPDIKDTMCQFAGPGFVDDEAKSDHDRLEAFRASIPTATSKEDIDNILLTRLIVACAKYYDCEGVIWGDSDSRLAAKTLASVAKGRGASLTWQVCDGISPWGVEFSFPLRDLYKSELQLYASQVPSLEEIVIPEQPIPENLSNRDLSIDQLMKHYIQTQGEKYPGVMANVVRTVNKLQRAPITADQARCALCAASLEAVGGATANGSADGTSSEAPQARFCYGCARSGQELVNRHNI